MTNFLFGKLPHPIDTTPEQYQPFHFIPLSILYSQTISPFEDSIPEQYHPLDTAYLWNSAEVEDALVGDLGHVRDDVRDVL